VRRSVIALALCLALLTALAAIGLAACGGSSSSSVPKDAVATVGGVSISKAKFDELVTQATTEFKSKSQTFPKAGTALYNQYAAQMIGYLVTNELVSQSASKYGATVTDAQVESQYATMQKAYGGAATFAKTIKTAGMSVDLLKRTIRADLLTKQVQTALFKNAKVSDTAVKAYWDAHKATLGKKKATATYAKAKATIQSTLLAATQQKIWADWLAQRSKALGVKYASGYNPSDLVQSASPSPSATSTGG
jgi:foldase protein PrsA